jgi:hypothetical protein
MKRHQGCQEHILSRAALKDREESIHALKEGTHFKGKVQHIRRETQGERVNTDTDHRAMSWGCGLYIVE